MKFYPTKRGGGGGNSFSLDVVRVCIVRVNWPLDPTDFYSICGISPEFPRISPNFPKHLSKYPISKSYLGIFIKKKYFLVFEKAFYCL